MWREGMIHLCLNGFRKSKFCSSVKKRKTTTAMNGRCVVGFGDDETQVSVSYTHLDVYKRQIEYCTMYVHLVKRGRERERKNIKNEREREGCVLQSDLIGWLLSI